MVTFTKTRGTFCEACRTDAPITYRIHGDANADACCEECATDYAARVFCAEVWPIPSDAWNADTEEVTEHAAGWYDGGIEALRRDAGILADPFTATAARR